MASEMDTRAPDTGTERSSTVGGPITRAEVLARARNWLGRAAEMQFDDSRHLLSLDIDGQHRYGQDCSGMVSMAWHLAPAGGGPTTNGLANTQFTVPIDSKDLRPGDALDNTIDGEGHVILFEAWQPGGRFSWIAFGVDGMSRQTDGSFTAANLAGWPTVNYRAIRYRHIVEVAVLEREPDGTIAVIAGGAPFRFSSMAELKSCGYDGVPWSNVPAGTLAKLPRAPQNGTVLNLVDGRRFVVAGGAAFWFPTWAEYVAAGYGTAPAVNVPTAPTLALEQATAANGTLIRVADGRIFVMAGGAAFWFPTWADYVAAGYEKATVINVPTTAATALAARTAADRTLIRVADGRIFVVAGGAAFWFPTWAEYVAAGYERAAVVNVPPTAATALAARTAADGTLVRSASSPQVWVVTGGHRSPLSAGATRTVVTIPDSSLEAIPVATALSA